MALPNLLGIGAQRAGSNWLRAQLIDHPGIFVPERRTEVGFFDEDYARGLDWYRGFFPDADASAAYRWIADISPRYLHDPAAPERIAACLPDPRFIVILRQPADRAYSHYGLMVRNRNERAAFPGWLQANPDMFRRGLYGEHLARYLAVFPRERFLILIFEEAMADKSVALGQIADFLGLPPGEFAAGRNAHARVNDSYRAKFARSYSLAHRLARWLRAHNLDSVLVLGKRAGLGPHLFGRQGSLPPLDPATRRELTARYARDISHLETLLGRSLDLWRGPP